MSAKKRGLGRGLDALLGGSPAIAETTNNGEVSANTPSAAQESALKEIPIEFLQRGKYQPRKDMHPEALDELAASIRAQGVMQPIVVRPVGDNKYEIIAGERRWRASQIAQMDTIPAVIKDVSDDAAIAMALIENIQREDLNPIEEAEALHRLQEEFELTHQEVADAVGKSRAAVSNLLRLMSLSLGARTLLENGDLEMGHARAMLSLPEVEQSQTAKNVVARGLSVRQTEELVRKLLKENEEGGASSKTQTLDPDTRQLQDNLSEKLCASVQIQHTAKGKGKLIIAYNNLDELDGILDHIK